MWCMCFPALVPRGDFLDQLLKWSIIEFEENGRRGYGMKMVVDICEEYLNVRAPPTPALLASPSVPGLRSRIVECAEKEEPLARDGSFQN